MNDLKKCFWLVAVLVALAWFCVTFIRRESTRESLESSATAAAFGEPLIVEGEQVFDVVPKDALRAIFQPTFVSAREAQISPDAPVIGITDGLEARAYSIFLLDGHEIVNDSLKGKSIAVTW